MNRAWDEVRDTPRIRKAFTILAGSRTAWPTPSHLIEAMPASGQKQLPRSSGIPATREEREAYLEKLRMVYGNVVKPIN